MSLSRAATVLACMWTRQRDRRDVTAKPRDNSGGTLFVDVPMGETTTHAWQEYPSSSRQNAFRRNPVIIVAIGFWIRCCGMVLLLVTVNNRTLTVVMLEEGFPPRNLRNVTVSGIESWKDSFECHILPYLFSWENSLVLQCFATPTVPKIMDPNDDSPINNPELTMIDLA